MTRTTTRTFGSRSEDRRSSAPVRRRRHVGTRRPQPRRRFVARGFTLIETALATVIVGVGVLAMMTAHTAFHRQNHWATLSSTAERLGNEIREATLNLPRHDPVTGQLAWGPEDNEGLLGDFDDIDDFDGAGDGTEYSSDLGNGPINAARQVIPNMNGWSQVVTVHNTDPFDIRADGDTVPDGSTDVMVVEVVVFYQGPGFEAPQEMTRVSWIVPN